MNYSYSTTIYKIILIQMYVFLVLYTIFDFYHEIFISKNWETILPEMCTFGWKYLDNS